MRRHMSRRVIFASFPASLVSRSSQCRPQDFVIRKPASRQCQRGVAVHSSAIVMCIGITMVVAFGVGLGLPGPAGR